MQIGSSSTHQIIPTVVPDQQIARSSGKSYFKKWNQRLIDLFASLQTACVNKFARTGVQNGAATLANKVADAAKTSLKCCPKSVAVGDEILPLDPALTMKRLDNGFIYYVRHHDYPFPHRAQLQLVIRAGFLNETREERGIAHLIEHIAQHQTENFGKGEIDKYFASKGMSWGGDTNAHTNSTSTVYKLNLPLDDPEILEKALYILSEVAQKATLSDSLIDAEREIVIDELRLIRGANHRYKKNVFPTLLEGTPYVELNDLEHEIDNVKNCPAEVVRNFYKRWYQPENMALVVVGDFDTKQVEGIIVKHFGSMPPSKQSPSKHEYVTTARNEAQFLTFTDPEITLSKVEIFHRLSPVEHSDKITLAKIKTSFIVELGLGMLNERFKEIQLQPKPHFLLAASCHKEIIPNCPYFCLSVLSEEGEIEKGYKQLLLEMKRLRQHGFTEAELKRLKAELLSGLEHQILEKNKSSMLFFVEQYRRHFLENSPASNPDRLCELKKNILPTISLREINAVFKNLGVDNPIVAASMPQKTGLTPIVADSLKQIFEDVKNEKVEAYVDETIERPLLSQVPTPGAISKMKLHTKAEVVEYTLSNGMRVLVKPTTFVNDKISIFAYAVKGSRSVSPNERFAAMFSEHFYDCCGIGDFELNELLKYCCGKNVELESEIDSYTTELSINSGKKDLETAFQLFYLVFTNPGYNVKAFDIAKKRVEESLLNSKNNPISVFQKAIIATNTQDDPAFVPITLEDLKQIDYETCKHVHQRFFSNPADFTIVITGNVVDSGVKELIERYMASLPQMSERSGHYDFPPVLFPPGITRKEVYAGKESACVTCWTFPASVEDSYNENRLSAWCSQLLKKRLIEVLRTQLGKTYSPSCVFQKAAIPGLSATNPSKTQVVISCDPSNLKELEIALIHEIRFLQAGGLSEEDLADYKKEMAKSYMDGLQTNSVWMNFLVYLSLWNVEIDSFDAFKKQLEELNLETVKNHFKKLLNVENYSMVTLLPEATTVGEEQEIIPT